MAYSLPMMHILLLSKDKKANARIKILTVLASPTIYQRRLKVMSTN